MKHEYTFDLEDEVHEIFTNAEDEYRELVRAALSELLPDIDLEEGFEAFAGEYIEMVFTDHFDIILTVDIDGLAENYELEPAAVKAAIEKIELGI